MFFRHPFQNKMKRLIQDFGVTHLPAFPCGLKDQNVSATKTPRHKGLSKQKYFLVS